MASEKCFMLHKYSLAKLNECKVIKLNIKLKRRMISNRPAPSIVKAHHPSSHVQRKILQVHRGKSVIVLITFAGFLKQINHVSLLKESPLNYVAQK